MKIAIVWNHPSRLLDCSFRFEQYEAGFQSLGHETSLICHRGCEEGRPGARGVEPERLKEPEFWRGLGVDVAVLTTWHRMSAELEAARSAGLQTVAITDSDGQVGLRAHPRMTLLRMWVYLQATGPRLRCLHYFLGRWLRESLRGSPEDDEMTASTRASDAVVFGSEGARQAFRRLLSMQNAAHLDDRVLIAPLLIGESFFNLSIPEKKPRVAAIGRWDDPQKNAPLLAEALEIFLRARPEAEVRIFGGGDPEIFVGLRKFPGFVHHGLQPQNVVAETLAESRSIVFSSRWEGSPHAATEALALGGTIVGTPIPALTSWTEHGRFGRIAAPKPRELARALSEEMDAWDRGERNAAEIAEYWRGVLRPEEICRRILAKLPKA